MEVTIDFGRNSMDSLFTLASHTRIHLPGVERTVAEELVRNTERFCPYAKMARQGILNIVTLALADDASGS